MLDECIVVSDRPLKKSTQIVRKLTKPLRVIACDENSHETWQAYYQKLNVRRGRTLLR